MAAVTTLYSSTTDSVAITITLAGLATSATLVAGQQSDIVTHVGRISYQDVLTARNS